MDKQYDPGTPEQRRKWLSERPVGTVLKDSDGRTVKIEHKGHELWVVEGHPGSICETAWSLSDHLWPTTICCS